MRARRTPKTNVTLTLPGAGDERNLPATRIMAYDAELGETPDDAHQAFATTWVPDDGERKAIANGAPIELIIHGSGHPPVSVAAGEPPEDAELVALISKAHVDRAVGAWFALLSEHLIATDEFPTAPQVLEMWKAALEATKNGELVDVDLVRETGEAFQREAINAGDPCSCEPKPSGEAPDRPDPACPIHGAGV